MSRIGDDPSIIVELPDKYAGEEAPTPHNPAVSAVMICASHFGALSPADFARLERVCANFADAGPAVRRWLWEASFLALGETPPAGE